MWQALLSMLLPTLIGGGLAAGRHKLMPKLGGAKAMMLDSLLYTLPWVLPGLSGGGQERPPDQDGAAPNLSDDIMAQALQGAGLNPRSLSRSGGFSV